MSTYTHQSVPAGTIVVGVDGSGSSDQALAWAVRHAQLEHRALTIAHAVPSTLNPAGDLAAGHRVVAAAHDEARRRAPGLEVHEVVSAVDPRSLLIELSEHAATVVVGSRGRGPLASMLLGSVGAALARHAHCPVVVHRPTRPGLVRRGVLVGVDGAVDSTDVLEHAFRLASQRGLPLTVLHCYGDVLAASAAGQFAPPVDPVDHEVLLSESMAGMREKFPDVHVTVDVVRRAPEGALVAMAKHMDLVVVGAHHGGLASAVMFGSVAATVVEHATCPVMVVRH